MSESEEVEQNPEKKDEEDEGEKTDRKEEPPWEKYQKMSVEEKRKYYRCGDRYKQIKDIETWSKYYQVNGHYFSEIIRSKPVFPVNAKINDKVSLWKGDITCLEIDAIVNAANRMLLGGGGVDGCIHRAAGDTLVQECRLLNGCDTGKAKITSGHKLPARYVIHTVGPIGKDKKALTNCYENCLELALENKVRTLAFCCISTGIYGYPNKDAAEVALKTTRQWLDNEANADRIDRIIFCLFLDKDIKIYHTLMLKYFPPEELQKPTKKQGDESAKENTEKDKVTKEPEKKTYKKEDEIPKRDDVKSDKNVDGEKDSERKTERNEEDEKRAEKIQKKEEKLDLDEEMKKVDEMQMGREKSNVKETDPVTGAEDENALNAEGMQKKEEKHTHDEVKKAEETQRGQKVKDDDKVDAVKPASKRQKQEDVHEKLEEEDVEMIVEGESPGNQEENAEGQKQNKEIQKQDENMEVGEDPKQETDEKEGHMRTVKTMV